MSKYVKEMMMDQLKNDLGETRSVLIIDFKGLGAIAETQMRRDLRKKSIKLRALKNTLARQVFAGMGLDGLHPYLEGPSVAVWGGAGVAELAKEVSNRVKALKKPEIKGGAIDGVIIGPAQVEDITKLPSREVLIARVVDLALSPVRRVIALANAPAAALVGQIQSLAERPEAAPTSEAAPPEAQAEAAPVVVGVAPPADAAEAPSASPAEAPSASPAEAPSASAAEAPPASPAEAPPAGEGEAPAASA